MSEEWRSYRHDDSPDWLLSLPQGRIRNSLLRERLRLRALVTNRHYFGPEKAPIEPQDLAAMTADLASWEDPAAVLRLIRSGGIFFLGPKTRTQAIGMIENYLKETA